MVKCQSPRKIIQENWQTIPSGLRMAGMPSHTGKDTLMSPPLSKKLKILFLSVGLIFLGTVLALEFQASSPKGKLEGGTLQKAEKSLDTRMGEKIHALNMTLKEQDHLPRDLFVSHEVRYEGQVFQATVDSEWATLPKRIKGQILKTILENYRNSRQQRMKETGEPTIIFLEGEKKVAVHTVLEDIIH